MRHIKVLDEYIGRLKSEIQGQKSHIEILKHENDLWKEIAKYANPPMWKIADHPSITIANSYSGNGVNGVSGLRPDTPKTVDDHPVYWGTVTTSNPSPGLAFTI